MNRGGRQQEEEEAEQEGGKESCRNIETLQVWASEYHHFSSTDRTRGPADLPVSSSDPSRLVCCYCRGVFDRS